MFGYKHYVPVLRWKQGEYGALKALTENETSMITPLIEILPKSFKSLRRGEKEIEPNEIEIIVDQIEENWGEKEFFIDLHLINPNILTTTKKHPFSTFRKCMTTKNLAAIPVTGLKRDADYTSAALQFLVNGKRRLALRLSPTDVLNPAIASQIREFLDLSEIIPSEIDLLVDLQIVNAKSNFSRIVETLPYLSKWRTFTIIQGSFPKDLSKLMKPGEYFIPRYDWTNWTDQVSNTTLDRLPSFGDYAIQHPIYSEPPTMANYSASIRYTSEKDWLIMRGEGVRNVNSAGTEQWPANAEILCQKDEFCGESYSFGDLYIYSKQMSKKPKTTGSAMTWIRAGLNHHLVFVSRQIRALS